MAAQRHVVEHHDDAEEQGGEARRGSVAAIARQKPRHPIVGFDTVRQIAGETLAEELDRQAQDVPGESSRFGPAPA